MPHTVKTFPQFQRGCCGTNSNPNRNPRLSQRFSTSRPSVRKITSTNTYRAGVSDFDLEKPQLKHKPISIWSGDRISSVTGGFTGVLAQSVVQWKAPSLAAAGHRAGRLCFCFAICTHFSISISPEELLPKPFWYC